MVEVTILLNSSKDETMLGWKDGLVKGEVREGRLDAFTFLEVFSIGPSKEFVCGHSSLTIVCHGVSSMRRWLDCDWHVWEQMRLLLGKVIQEWRIRLKRSSYLPLMSA